MKKKNYSVIVAFALIAILIVATICVGCSKKESDNDIQFNNGSGDNVDYINENLPLINDYPDLEKNTEIDENGNKINVSEAINQEKISFDFIDFTNISLKYVDGLTEFRANVVNNSDTNYPEGINLKISFMDDDGMLIYVAEMMTSTLNARGESNIQGRFTRDCSYAKSFNVEVIK